MLLLSINQLNLEWQDPKCIIAPRDVQQITRIGAAVLRGDPIEPVVIYYDGDTCRLFDGFHRVAAAKAVGRKEIEAEIRAGGLAEMKAEGKRELAAINEANARWPREHQQKKRSGT
jgi:hypothetical protein